MSHVYTLAAMLTFIVALLELQNATASGQTLFGYPLVLWLAGAFLLWMGQKKQEVL